jgi:PadR family transcriptional regulator PadR
MKTAYQDVPPIKLDLRQGTLDLLILRTLFGGEAHGRAIAKYIQGTSEELLQVEAASLYPALHRLEAKGWIAASWELSNKKKRAKYYHLTVLGRNKFVIEQSKWQAFERAMRLILNPVVDEGQ